MGENPELIAMARRIAAASYVGNDPWQDGLRTDILNGNCDDGPVVSAALAAIIETQERDAALAERLFDKGGCHAMYKNAGHQAAAAIRSGQHYGKDHPHA